MLMYPQIDPVALQLGPVAIHWYGLTYLAAFGLFLWLGARRAATSWDPLHWGFGTGTTCAKSRVSSKRWVSTSMW